MKIILFVCVALLATTAHAQRLTQKEAGALIEKAIESLKANDTATFIALWNYENPDTTQRPFDKDLAKNYFGHVNEWMDTAFMNNIRVDRVDIEKQTQHANTPYRGQYLIKAWFSYSDGYSKGFGFYVSFINGAWYFRERPETSVACSN